MLLSLVAVLIAGTLKVVAADRHGRHASLCRCRGPRPGRPRCFQWVPFDAAKGEEGVSVQGSVLIVLLLLIGLYRVEGPGEHRRRRQPLDLDGAGPDCRDAAGGGDAPDAPSRRAGNCAHRPCAGGRPGPVGRVALCAATRAADDWRAWLWEAWRFVKQIFVLLVVGVFVVGVVRQLIQPEWIQNLAGSNTLLANAVAVGFGVFMYFPTLVEVPVARMFLDLGMHPGPLLAYLMADPELSLQSMLMVAAVIGRPRPALTWAWWRCSAPGRA